MEGIIKSRLREYIKPGDAVLDIGCGNKNFSRIAKNTTTVDAWEKVCPDYLIDIEKVPLPFNKESFDYILLLDVIEHLEKEAGFKVLEQCKTIVRTGIFVYTPMFWDDNSKNVNNKKCWAYGNQYNLHKSFWDIEQDFKRWTTLEILKEPEGSTWLGYWQK